MTRMLKNWDEFVVHAEEVARTQGFRDLRDRILALAAPRPGDVVVDIGSGTGLLALDLAPRVEHVWAIDIAPAMGEYLSTKAASAGLVNVQAATSSAVSLPLVDATADLAVSNYCFHHLDDEGKRRALAEIRRVLRPGGRLVFGDMMFRVGVADARDREVVAAKVKAIAAKGPAGFVRLARNGMRFASGRWEHPAPAAWWRAGLLEAGFTDISVEELSHEGGVASATSP